MKSLYAIDLLGFVWNSIDPCCTQRTTLKSTEMWMVFSHFPFSEDQLQTIFVWWISLHFAVPLTITIFFIKTFSWIRNFIYSHPVFVSLDTLLNCLFSEKFSVEANLRGYFFPKMVTEFYGISSKTANDKNLFSAIQYFVILHHALGMHNIVFPRVDQNSPFIREIRIKTTPIGIPCAFCNNMTLQQNIFQLKWIFCL